MDLNVSPINANMLSHTYFPPSCSMIQSQSFLARLTVQALPHRRCNYPALSRPSWRLSPRTHSCHLHQAGQSTILMLPQLLIWRSMGMWHRIMWYKLHHQLNSMRHVRHCGIRLCYCLPLVLVMSDMVQMGNILIPYLTVSSLYHIYLG
jgi:hypothetical protein